MNALSRWLAPAVVSAGFGMAALAAAPARAGDDDLARVIVDIADVVLRGGVPYYRHDNYGHDDRLVVVHDRFGRPVYYRQLPRRYLQAGYYRDDYRYARNVKCNKRGKCTVTYYDPRHDRTGHRDRYYYRDDRRRW